MTLLRLILKFFYSKPSLYMNAKDWKGDKVMYVNACGCCGDKFFGDKWRTICKECCDKKLNGHFYGSKNS